jgi:hypothetical protein
MEGGASQKGFFQSPRAELTSENSLNASCGPRGVVFFAVFERESVGMTFLGLLVGLIGNILDYWGGSPGEGFAQVQVTGFGIE